MQIYPTHCLQLPRRLHAPKLNSMPAPAPAPAPLLVSFRSVRCGSSGFPRHVNIIKLCTNKSNHGAARCEEQTARMQPPSTGNTHVSICFKLVCTPLPPCCSTSLWRWLWPPAAAAAAIGQQAKFNKQKPKKQHGAKSNKILCRLQRYKTV